MSEVAERLAVSTAGMREFHAAREAWQLLKEPIQNSWDEVPAATRCDVRIIADGDMTLVEVEDDGPGFRRIEDAFTLMGPTPKRSDPRKRGRFNLGQKEFIVVASEARVETVGSTVVFPAEGGREVSQNTRVQGTLVSGRMPWDGPERQRLIEKLATFRPTDCSLYVNGLEVCHREPVAVRDCILPTVLQNGPGEPLRRTRRRTRIEILPKRGERALIYEMGIPIQTTEFAYDVDILQKVPMPPNRDTVADSYLRAVSAELLNATFDIMSSEDAGETWVQTAIEDSRVSAEAVRDVMSKRYGDHGVVLWSSRTDSNLRAAEAGFEIIHPKAISSRARMNMRNLGGLQSAHDVFGRNDDHANAKAIEPDESMEAFAEWVRELARRAGLDARVKFIEMKSNYIVDCTASTSSPLIRFNLHQLTPEFFEGRGERQLELVIHELGHALCDKPMEHGPAWGEGCCRAAARIAAPR